MHCDVICLLMTYYCRLHWTYWGEFNDALLTSATDAVQSGCGSTRTRLGLLWFDPASQLPQLSYQTACNGHHTEPESHQAVSSSPWPGVLFDNELSMRRHVSRRSRTCFFTYAVCAQLVVNEAMSDVITRLVTALVRSTVRLLQRCFRWFAGVDSALVRSPARGSANCSWRQAAWTIIITPALQEWLPITEWMQCYQLCLLGVHGIYIGEVPEYVYHEPADAGLSHRFRVISVIMQQLRIFRCCTPTELKLSRSTASFKDTWK